MCHECVRTPFRPRVHGFPFSNSFPAGRATLTINLGVLSVHIGDAGKGLCGGMVFAAEDFRRSDRPIPRDRDSVYEYLCRRLLDSFNLPSAILKLYSWMLRPDRSRTVRSVPALTVRSAWPTVRRRLRDRGQPVALMLVKVQSANPFRLGENHQVLAYGYDRDPANGQVQLYVYDPNYPLVHSDDPPPAAPPRPY